jgi:hypothetical protein
MTLPTQNPSTQTECDLILAIRDNITFEGRGHLQHLVTLSLTLLRLSTPYVSTNLTKLVIDGWSMDDFPSVGCKNARPQQV